mgnify:CR=1 FL=1
MLRFRIGFSCPASVVYVDSISVFAPPIPTTAFSEDANTLMLIHSLAPNNQTYILDGGSISTAGSINSSVMANPTYGQSIVSYTGTQSNDTVGHGLSSVPEMIIVKNRTNAKKRMNKKTIAPSAI